MIPVLSGVFSGTTWRKACLVGLASGVGFGVAEGILYSGRTYNGLLGADIYFVRFLSCVALHAIWAGTAAIMLYRNSGTVSSADSWWAPWVTSSSTAFRPSSCTAFTTRS